MFGSEYSKESQVLLLSFGGMSASYKKKIKKKKQSMLVSLLQSLYVKIFGIPEIGFQIRSMYFERIMNEKLGNKRFNNILDAGSGIGVYTFWLAKKYSSANVIGGDIDKNKLSFSAKFKKKLNLSNVFFEYLDVTKTNKKNNFFDLIVTIDVLEHIDNYKKVLKNFYNIINPGGYLYIHTPQPNQSRIFKSLNKWSHEGHTQEGYTPWELKQELEKLGFKIVVIQESFGFFGKLAWELNHISFRRGFVISGMAYPVLYVLALFDLATKNKGGLGTAILARKT